MNILVMLSAVVYDRFIDMLKRAWKPRIDKVELSQHVLWLIRYECLFGDQNTSLTVLVSLKVNLTN